ncbi:MAG: hypothetical protein AB7I32_07890 [Gammaproteobacteria bacterium]
MNRFKVVARQGHHALVEIDFEDEHVAKAMCDALSRITGVVLAGSSVVLTPREMEGALRTNGGLAYFCRRGSVLQAAADEPPRTPGRSGVKPKRMH